MPVHHEAGTPWKKCQSITGNRAGTPLIGRQSSTGHRAGDTLFCFPCLFRLSWKLCSLSRPTFSTWGGDTLLSAVSDSVVNHAVVPAIPEWHGVPASLMSRRHSNAGLGPPPCSYAPRLPPLCWSSQDLFTSYILIGGRGQMADFLRAHLERSSDDSPGQEEPLCRLRPNWRGSSRQPQGQVRAAVRFHAKMRREVNCAFLCIAGRLCRTAQKGMCDAIKPLYIYISWCVPRS